MIRVASLDSVRGLAAVSVVICHYLIVLANAPVGKWVVSCFRFPPLSLFATAFGPVMLFFVLSGYVLTLSLLSDRKPNWIRFGVQRFFRIWPTYAVTIVASFTIGHIALAIDPAPPVGWEANSWHGHEDSTTIVAFVDQITMVCNSIGLDVAAWSLVHELRISLVFPLLLVCVQRFPRTAIAVSLCLHIAGRSGPPWLSHFIPETATYLLYFTAGAWLAINQKLLVRSCLKRTTSLEKILLGTIAIFLLSTPSTHPIGGIMVGLGAILVITLVTSSPSTGQILSSPCWQFLGRVSYSLYLTHVVVLMALGTFLGGWLPIPLVLIIAFPIISIITFISYKWVEQPSIKLAREFTTRF